MAVMHTRADEMAAELADTLQDQVSVDRIMIGPAGSALATHLGLGAVGICALAANGRNRAVGTNWRVAGSDCTSVG
jgi:fatty acid-binding protein DegV